MILCFPDLDTFRLVVTSTMLPADVTLTPATACLTDDGRVFIDTPAKLGKKAAGELSKIGVSGAKTLPGDGEPISCWLQVLPATKDAAPPQLASQAPVLFELPAATDLPGIVGELLRLGNDRQSFRFLGDDKSSRRVLLRVIGPPYYTLLRAIDQIGNTGGQPIRAYVEAAPRVWVQIGYTHPAGTGVKPADGQLLLVRPPRDWEYLADAPFQDVYDILQFKLPTTPADWKPVESKDKLTVPLKLTAGNAADTPELWVLKADAIGQLDRFVRDSDERVTSRLKFAVADAPSGEKVVVLRVSPSKLAPPQVVFGGAVGFKPYFKLPNLFLPVGTRLHPQLRRDAVRSLLADDTDRVVWLYPGENGQFVPETLSENAFRPLEDWVDYVIEQAHAPLKEWIDASRFAFEQFICSETPTKPKPPSDKPDGKGKGTRDDGPIQPTGKGGRKKAAADGDQAVVVGVPVGGPPKPPDEWKIRREQLEKDFLAVDGPLDAPERIALWPQLAVANAGAGDPAEAAVCWANAAWPADSPAILAAWADSESAGVPTEKEFDRLLKQADPTRADVRQAVGATFAVLAKPPLPDWFRKKLPDLQRYFEANEAKLAVRTVWLLAAAVAKAAGADVLGLARVRDRLLRRLLDGLNPELDIPFFLRSAGLNDSARVRLVRDRLPELHRAARAWVAKPPTGATATVKSTAPTLPYIDLLFAFAYAKLGEAAVARTVMEDARKQLSDGKPTPDQVTTRTLIFRAYQYRIEQCLANRPHAGPLPPDLVAEIDEFQKKNPLGGNAPGGNAPQNLGHYPIARLREQSKVLEPQEKHDPYNEWMKHGDELKKHLAELPKIKDPGELAKRIRELYRTGGGGRSVAECRFLVLHEGMPFAARVSEEFTVELLGLVPETMAAAGTGIAELGKKQGQLLERSLFLAAHFDRRDLLQQLVDQFVSVLQSKPDDDRFEIVNYVAGQCLRSLRKLGLQDEIDRLLKKLVEVVLGKQSLQQFRARHASSPIVWGKALQSLLHVAGGWMTFGLTAQALPILDEARGELLGSGGASKLTALEFSKLCEAYISAVGHGPVEGGLPRLAELLTGLDPNRVTNTFTTAQFYSRLHLRIVEEMVLALASDEFALGATGRRWLEDDEKLVRDRIHADMRKYLSAGGL